MYSDSIAKRAFVILTLLSLFFIDTYSTTPAKMLKKELKFQKVQEKTYNKIIKDMAFDKTIVDGEVNVYPKVVVFGDEVQFLNRKGEIVSRKSLVVTKPKEAGKYFGKNAILSTKGNFIAISEYTGVWGDPVNYKIEEQFTIYNDIGEEIYNINGIVEGKGEEDRWLISDKDGSIVGTRIEYGAIDFYSPNGKVKTVQLFSELGWKRRTGRVSFSGNGEYLALLLNELIIEKAKPREKDFSFEADVWVILFDKSGNELWRKHVDEVLIGNIAISNKGEYLIFKAYSYEKLIQKPGEPRELSSLTLSLCDREGNDFTLTDTSLFTLGGFRFSPKEDYVALEGANLIRLMRTEDNSTVFEKKLPENHGIRDILFADEGEFLIVKTETPIGIEEIGSGHITIYTKSVFVFNMQGDKVWQNNFSDLDQITSQDGNIVFLFPQHYEIYREN